MIVKLIVSLIGILCTRYTLMLIIANYIHFNHTARLEFSFDFTLLNQYPKLMLIINIVTALISVMILSGMFSKSISKKKDKDQKNFSHLSSIHEAKRSLTRVQFKKTPKNWVMNENSKLTKVDLFFDPFKIYYNKVITFFRIDDWHKLNTIKHFQIGNEDHIMRSGIPIYTPRFRKKTIFVDANDNHNLIYGTTNSGKTFSIVLQMIELMRMAKESGVINDPKGEIYEYTAQQFKDDGYDVIRLNFINPEAGDGWDILEQIWTAWKNEYQRYSQELSEWNKKARSLSPAEKAVWLYTRPEPDYSVALEYLRDMCNTLTNDPNLKDPFWNESAGDLLFGAIAFLMEESVYFEDLIKDHINFKSVRFLLSYADIKLTKEQKELLEVHSDNVLGAIVEKTRKQTDISYMHLIDYCKLPDQTKQSVKKVLNTKINMLTMNEQIMRMTSYSTFNVSDLGKKKMVIYLIVHDEKKTFYPIVTIFLNQLYEAIINEARGHKGRLPIPVNIILDEFGNFPNWKNVQSALTAGRSRGVRFTLAIQDTSQLEETYGKSVSTTIQNNCLNTIYILGSQPETLKSFSEMCGSRLVWIPSRKWYESRPVITIDRLQKLNVGEVVIHRQRKSPFVARMIPYNKCKFYQGKNANPNELLPPKPKVKHINLSDKFIKYGIEI